MHVSWSKVALFFSGSFCCGAVNHTIAGLQQRVETPYGIRVGVAGNWVLFAFDVAMMFLLLWVHHHFTAKERANAANVQNSDDDDRADVPRQ
ncbi:MAG TPA: hypothetical protein VGF28_11420 [Thermoanaerobaculia bacterium]|jgi:uncharacterized membrane protein